MWLVTLETKDGMWSDDPVGGFTKAEAVEIAIKRWPKPDPGEMRVLYKCSAVEEIKDQVSTHGSGGQSAV